MNLQDAKALDGARWAWVRTGALIFFLVTGILLVASLIAVRGQQESALANGAGYAHPTAG